ncbi:MAG: phosphoribosylformylglycinamidine synthase subunit PurL [Pseudobdellovibrionaceae bacterium]
MIAEKLKKYRLNESEYQKISELLGRPPEGLEWALFSALWSEHCSYKSSKIHLRKFKYHNEKTQGQTLDGENAGVVNLGQGERIIFKMESHNHPSFIEPFHGAATGVGGILRDIFTMGARPIALANFLCFGALSAPRMKMLVQGVVDGISHYGNCVGVPMLSGKTQFDSRYNHNILVNAMAVGYLGKNDVMASSKAHLETLSVIYVGAKTGADGVHGASMASESFTSDNESKRPNIQIGDPFLEKLLIEACLEVIQKKLVVAIQDMGAAGLTSSSFEMSAKSGRGFDMDLSLVPLRQDLTPEDILLSESQERMLLLCTDDNKQKIFDVFSRWGLDAVEVGRVLDAPEMKLRWGKELLCEINPSIFTDHAPKYERPFKKWDRFLMPLSEIKNFSDLPKIEWNRDVYDPKSIYERYDQRVGGKTIRSCNQSVGFVRLPESGRGMAIALGCRSQILKVNAALGGFDAAFFPALQMASKGAVPVAMTDCLNFGNPEKLEIMTEFVECVEQLAHMAEVLDAPVISGNVSFYNETRDQSIISTPAIGQVGLTQFKDLAKIPFDDVESLKSSGAFTDLKDLAAICLWSDQVWMNQEHGFFGQFDISKLELHRKELLQAVLQSEPVLTKALGYSDFHDELLKMFGSKNQAVCKEISASWSEAIQKRLEGQNPEFSKNIHSGFSPLYRSIILLPQHMVASVTQIFKASSFVVFTLGSRNGL